MDLISFVVVSCVFTVFGYFWGKASFTIDKVHRIVASTMDSLEKDGYLKSKYINGEQHYIKWPEE